MLRMAFAIFAIGVAAPTAMAQGVVVNGVYMNTAPSAGSLDRLADRIRAQRQAQLYGPYGTGSNSRSHTTRGYVTNQGTYVAPHRATNPNGTQMDNYGTRGNVNPYTGQTGTRTPRR